MKAVCLILFGSLLLARSALSTVCPVNFDERFSGKLKEADPKRPLFRLLKNDVRDGYEPGQELTLSLHSLVASRPMKGYLVTAKSLDGRCGNGRMVAQRSLAKIRPGCQNVIESAMKEWKTEASFGFRAPECGCIMIKATVIAAMHDIAYVDAAGVFEGPLTLTLCPWPEAVTAPTPPKKKVVEHIVEHAEYKRKGGGKDSARFDEVVAPTETTLIDLVDAVDGGEDENDFEDENDLEDEFDDLEDALPVDDDDDDDDYDEDDDSDEDEDADVVVVDVGEIEEDEDDDDDAEFDDDSSDSSDLDSSSEEDQENSSESDEFESSKQYAARRRPWSSAAVNRHGAPGWRMTHRRQHGRRGRKMPHGRPHGGRRGPPRHRRPGFINRVPPSSPVGARFNGRFNHQWRRTDMQGVSAQKPKQVISRFDAQKMIPEIQKAVDQKMGFQGRRFGLLKGRKNPLGLVRHHLMGPPDFLIDRLCLAIEKILDKSKDEDSMNALPFQMPHFFGCPDSTGHEKTTYRKRGPPGFEKEQAKRRMGEFDTAEIKKRWHETRLHTKSCCGKTGPSRYSCIRRQRMDVVCAPDFQVPLCANPSTTLVRWKIAEARDTCCGMTGIERYDCFNRTTHPVAGHPELNHGRHGNKRQQVELEDLEKQSRETTRAPPREEVPTVTAVIPEDRSESVVEYDMKAPPVGSVESLEDDQSESTEEDGESWLEGILDDDRDELGNRDIGPYKPKNENSAPSKLVTELEVTANDKSDDREMKRDFIKDIAMPVWKRGGLIERLRDLREEAEEILGEEDPIDDDEFRYSDEDLDDDDEEFDEDDEDDDSVEKEGETEAETRRSGHRRPRRRKVLKRCCWAGKRTSRNATSHRWATCVAKSKAIGNRLHGFLRKKCKAVFRRCCIRTTVKENILKKQPSSPVQAIVDAVKPVGPVIIQNVPSHVMAQAKKHIKTAWKPHIYKPRISVLDKPEEEVTKYGAE